MPKLILRDRQITFETSDADRERGRAQRRVTPRRALAELVTAEASATDILLEQNRDRVPELAPLRFARMLVDPLHFYRGAAAVMAADLAASPTSGIDLMACGDAHLTNFGVFASPDRTMIFDLNDFDEAAVAPAEWDLKRLVTSAILGARDRGFSEETVRDIAEATAEAYRSAMATMREMTVLERFYLRVEPENLGVEAENPGVAISKSLDKVIRHTLEEARKRTSDRAYDKLTELDTDGIPRFRETTLTRHVPLADETNLLDAVDEYMGSVNADVHVLLAHFKVTDIAMRVVGVGSVGTRCYLALLVDAQGTPLVLQVKEAKRSVLEEYGKWPQPPILQDAITAHGQGRRVVVGQRILQAMSDVFLGTIRVDGGHFYIRQFHDMKGSIELSALNETTFSEYTQGCAVVLARAHAQSARARVLHGYFGNGHKAIDAIITWCYRYADKTVADFEQVAAAARAGDIEVANDPQRK